MCVCVLLLRYAFDDPQKPSLCVPIDGEPKAAELMLTLAEQVTRAKKGVTAGDASACAATAGLVEEAPAFARFRH